MKKACVLVIVVIAASSAVFADNASFGGSASYSTVLATHGMRSSVPTAPEVYGRFDDLWEAALFGAIGSGEAKRFESYDSILAGVEVRLAPSARFYSPFAGLGVSYGFFNYAAVLPDDHMVAGYVSIAPLRFDLSRLVGHSLGIHPTVSVLQIKFGPFYNDGGNPSWFDMGNFVAVVDLIRIGVFYETKGE